MAAGFAGTYDSDYIRWKGGMFGAGEYRFVNDPDDPLEFTSDDNIIMRPAPVFVYDRKSAPWLLSAIAPKWFAKCSTPRSAAFHDSACKHHGVFIAISGGWLFTFLSRTRADYWFRTMIPYEGVGRIGAGLNWLGVRIGATWGSWGNDPVNDPVFQQYRKLYSHPEYRIPDVII